MLSVVLFALLNASPDAGAASPTVQAVNPWAGRSGKAEAIADIAAGRPVKLLYQGIAGERPELRTPGLLNCDPERYDVAKSMRSKFVHLDADYSESIQYTAEERAELLSATKFAKAYNTTMFAKKRRDVLRICPSAKPD